MESGEIFLPIIDLSPTILIASVCLVMTTTIVVWVLVECALSCLKVSSARCGAIFTLKW